MKQKVIIENNKVFLELTDKKVNLKIELDANSVSKIYWHQDYEYEKQDFDTIFEEGGIGCHDNPKILELLKKQYMKDMIKDFHNYLEESDEWVYQIREVFDYYYELAEKQLEKEAE